MKGKTVRGRSVETVKVREIVMEERQKISNTGLAFIVNPAAHSGKGKKLWEQAEHILNGRGVSYEGFLSGKKGDIEAIAKRLTDGLSDGEERTIVLLGGDGTVNEALQGIRDFDRVRLGYIPTGSSNDLARDMGISTKVEEALLPFLGAGKECRMDLGSVSWSGDGVRRVRRFLVGCGIGYDAEVCAEALSSKMKRYLNRVGLGKLTYLGIGLKQMLAVRYARVSVRLDGKEILHLPRMLFVVCMLHRYEGGGFCFCPQADAQDGLFDLCVVDGVPKWKFPVIIPFALKGKHFRFRGVVHYRAERIEIRADAPLCMQTDGEVPGKCDRLVITSERQKVRFIVPKL